MGTRGTRATLQAQILRVIMKGRRSVITAEPVLRCHLVTEPQVGTNDRAHRIRSRLPATVNVISGRLHLFERRQVVDRPQSATNNCVTWQVKTPNMEEPPPCVMSACPR